ncbi:MAG: class I tRNA ligase family protein, partial [Nitrosopumilus sp.]|nr:class I tRNA ligase family protein [Nitrosopumilus sp.]
MAEKIWSFEIEKRILNQWEKDNIYGIDDDNDNQLGIENYYILDTPPPYPSGKPWHIGAAAHYSQIDMIARVARSRGFKVI